MRGEISNVKFVPLMALLKYHQLLWGRPVLFDRSRHARVPLALVPFTKAGKRCITVKIDSLFGLS